MAPIRPLGYGKIISILALLAFWIYACAYHLPRSPTSDPQTEVLSTPSPYAYVFYATQDTYACSVLVNIFILKTIFQTKHRLITILSAEVSQEYRISLTNLGAIIIEEEPIPLHPNSIAYYRGCLLKLSAFKLHTRIKDIQRVLILDADQLIIRNLDHLFNLPLVPFQAPNAYWISESFLSSTLMLIEPSDKLWSLIYYEIQDIPSDQYDMDIINKVFQGTSPLLPGAYSTLNSHWEDWNLPLWSEIRSTSETSVSSWDLYNLYLESYVIHFTAIGKPWSYDLASIKEKKPYAHKALVQQWERWRSIALVACPVGTLDRV